MFQVLAMFLIISMATPAFARNDPHHGWCARLLGWISPNLELNQIHFSINQEPQWTRHLRNLGGFGTEEMAIFDRHLIARIEAMFSELTQEQQRIFIKVMGTIKFDPKRTYGAAYYRLLGEVGIEFDPNLYGHAMSRLVYIHELRHVVDDIKSGFPPQGMALDTLTTERAALGEGYDYLTLVNNDPDYDIDRFPKNIVVPERQPGEDDAIWAKRHYDDALGVDMNAVRKLSRDDYIKLTIKHYEQKVQVQSHSVWGELLKYASQKTSREKDDRPQ